MPSLSLASSPLSGLPGSSAQRLVEPHERIGCIQTAIRRADALVAAPNLAGTPALLRLPFGKKHAADQCFEVRT
jgi:hypothetical protein